MSTQLERSLFEAAIQLPPEERSAFVEGATEGAAALRAAVLSLLEFHQEPAAGNTLPVGAALSEALDLEVPERLGTFRILGLLGGGGMGVVYRAECADGAVVALKVLRPGTLSRELLSRFRREAEVLARLHHPGVARFLDAGILVGPAGDQPYLAMEWIEGQTLRHWATPERSIEERLAVLESVARAVGAAHEQGIVHRDLKPENIMIRPDGSPCVLDFGVARLTDSDIRATTLMTSMGAIVGTVRYMSPEQADPSKGPITPRSDVYGFGVVAWELLNERMPYEVPQDSVHRALVAVLTSEPGALDGFHDPRGKMIEAVLRRALVKVPADRHEDLRELAEDLRLVRAGQSPLRLGMRAARPSVFVWVAAVLVLAFLALGSATKWPWREQPPEQVLATALSHLDSAVARIQWQDRSVASMRRAVAHGKAAESLAMVSRRQPWSDDILLGALVMQSEAQSVLAEFTRDPAPLDTVIELCDRIDRMRLPFGSPTRLPDPTSPLALRIADHRRHLPGWRQASALLELSSHRDPSRLLSRAIALTDTAMQALLLHSGAGPDPVQCRTPYDVWPYFLLMHLGSSLRVKAHEMYGDADMLREGMRLQARLVLDTVRIADRRAFAAAIHTYGVGWTELATANRDTLALDSALTRLRFALRIRESFPANVSHVESRIALARALRLRSRLRSRMARMSLIEAESTLVRGFVHTSTLTPGLEADLALAMCDLEIDRAGLDADRSRVSRGWNWLRRAQALAAPHPSAVLRARWYFLEARLYGAEWSFSRDESSAARLSQSAGWCRDLMGLDRPYSWVNSTSRGRRAIAELPPDRPGLDYPVPAFSPGPVWTLAPRYPIGAAALRPDTYPIRAGRGR